MAAGAVDSTGIYQYGEDDLVASPNHSTFLNKLAASVTAVLGGAYTGYVPTFNNLTVGPGAKSGRYKKVGRNVRGHGYWTFAAGAAIGSNASMNLPFAASGAYAPGQIIGTVSFYDNTTTYLLGWLRLTASGIAAFMPASGTGIASTVPFTWVAGDAITWTFDYEAAS